jgi:hypothetical protein
MLMLVSKQTKKRECAQEKSLMSHDKTTEQPSRAEIAAMHKKSPF